MKFVRVEAGGERFYGVLHGNTISRIEGDMFAAWKEGDAYELTACKLLAPVEPSKIVCLGLNNAAHSQEVNMELPKAPLIFIKPSTSVIGPDDDIIYPAMSERVDYEAEMAVIIGKTCKNVAAQDVHKYIFGYSCLNDVTARDLQFSEQQWTRAKGFDTFCPIGPHIETELDYRDLRITARLNGETVQDAKTSNFIHDVPAMVSYISQIMTLLPGDVVATGTPSGIGPMQRGDCIDIEVEGIGVLRNTLV